CATDAFGSGIDYC
nr:immunoglobulin heavy chain junction region [Macaca mulatta]